MSGYWVFIGNLLLNVIRGMSSDQNALERHDGVKVPAEGVSRPVRPVAVRMTLPSTVDETAERSVSSGVACAVRDVFRSELRMRQVEFLSFPAAATGEQVYLLSGSVSSFPEPAERVESAGQVTLHDSISGREEPADGSMGHLASVLERKLRETSLRRSTWTSSRLIFRVLAHRASGRVDSRRG